jgi:hypothetical protein
MVWALSGDSQVSAVIGDTVLCRITIMAFECVPTTRQFARVDTRVKYLLPVPGPFSLCQALLRMNFVLFPFKCEQTPLYVSFQEQ